MFRGAYANKKRGRERHRRGGGWPLPTKNAQMQYAVPDQGPGGCFVCCCFFYDNEIKRSEQMNIISGQQT